MNLTDTVLVVEDHEGVRNLLSEVLSGSGLKVLKASNGEHAIRIADDQEIDLARDQRR